VRNAILWKTAPEAGFDGSSKRYAVTHDELERLRELLERSREPLAKVNAIRKTFLLIKGKFVLHRNGNVKRQNMRAET
jgi:hypothetical protein